MMASISEEEEIASILLCSSVMAMLEELRRAEQPVSRRRRWWVRPSLQERHRLGQANNLLPLLRDRDVEYYRDFLRMSPSSFDTLVELIGPRISKQDTRFRKAIPADHRLAQVIRFLAVGDTLRSSAFNFLAGRSTTCNLISEVCQAIWEVLGPIYLIRPSSPGEWLRTANDFEKIWQMPHCIGALDGKRVTIECPNKSGSIDRNYKNAFSKSMLAISDAHYRFLFVEMGHNGSESDGGNFGRSEFFRRVADCQQGIPDDSPLGDVGSTPYYFVGDEAFPLKTYLMRPYARKNLPPLFGSSEMEAEQQDGEPSQFAQQLSKRIFNYRLSRARRVIENAFGILAQRWRILRRPFKAKDDNVKRIISACVGLHNFLMTETPASRAAYCPPGSMDHEDWQGQLTEGSWRQETADSGALEPLPATGCHSTRLAYATRDKLCNYFIGSGKVSWQEDMIRGTRV